MDGFYTMSGDDFEAPAEQVIVLSDARKHLRPIILIPGVGGSRLEAINKRTGKSDVAWINASLRAPQKICQYLWGTMNERTGMFESYVKDYCDIRAIPGIAGCDYLIDNIIMETAVIGNYWGKTLKYFVKNHGYEYAKDIFAFTYDWR